ncbi:hypothetical protein CTM80_19430 [Photobacterium phosphoreum]|nr:hypothetical protein CTM80_19430 [Photobacterium phosphoreum]
MGRYLRTKIFGCPDNFSWVEKLIGGVDVKNEASKKLLQKVGFVAMEGNNQSVIFYEYNLCGQPHP